MNTTTIIVGVVSGVVCGGAGFYAGYRYTMSKAIELVLNMFKS